MAFTGRVTIAQILRSTEIDIAVTVKGWVRTKRGNKNVAFIALNDGSTINNIQIVVNPNDFSEELLKNITTGEGGLFLTDNEKLASDIRAWKFHGIGVDAFDRQNKGRSPQAEVIFPGFKYNLTDISAAIGVSQLKRLDAINAKRRELAMLYRELLADIPEIRPLEDPEGYDFTHAWHLFIVRVDSPKMDRNAFMNALKAENIGTGLHFRCCHLQKFYREAYGFSAGMLPATEYNSDHICSLPLFPDMSAEDVNDVVEAIKKVLA